MIRSGWKKVHTVSFCLEGLFVLLGGYFTVP